MTLTNMTFPGMTADAILAEDATHQMPAAHSSSTKPANAQPGDVRPTDDRRWNAIVARDSGQDGEFVMTHHVFFFADDPKWVLGNDIDAYDD